MANRLSIAEAPISALDKVGSTYELPVIETTDQGVQIPRKATVQSVRGAGGGGGESIVNHITRHRVNATGPVMIAHLGALLQREVTSSIIVHWVEATDGDTLFTDSGTEILANQVLLNTVGVWRITVRVVIRLRDTVSGGGSRFQPQIEITIGDKTTTFNRGYIRPQNMETFDTVYSQDFSIISRIALRTSIRTEIAVKNIGSAATSVNSSLDFSLMTGSGETSSELLAEYLGT